MGLDLLMRFSRVRQGISLRNDWRHLSRLGAHPDAKVLEELTKLIEAGKMKAIVSQTFPLADASKAQQQIETHHTLGKIVLKIADEKK